MWGEGGSGEDEEGENFVDRLQQVLLRNQELQVHTTNICSDPTVGVRTLTRDSFLFLQWALLDLLRKIDVALEENRRKQVCPDSFLVLTGL